MLGPLGPKARNLNKDYDYGDAVENQLTRWTEVGYLTGAPAPAAAPTSPALRRSRGRHCRGARARLPRRQLRPLPQPERPGAHLGPLPRHPRGGRRRATASASHRSRRGRAPAAAASTSSPASPTARSSSTAWSRPTPGVAMPELGRQTVHAEAVSVIREWIEGIEGTCCVTSCRSIAEWTPPTRARQRSTSACRRRDAI